MRPAVRVDTRKKKKTLSQVLILSKSEWGRSSCGTKKSMANGENLKRLKNFCVVPHGYWCWCADWFVDLTSWQSDSLSSRSSFKCLRALYSWPRHAHQILERNFNTHWPDTRLANKHTQSKQSHAIQSNRTTTTATLINATKATRPTQKHHMIHLFLFN